MNRAPNHFARAARGFTLIEILVAVVILATGLLALAALQGALARNSADAKARGAIMAALNSRMAEIRVAPPAAGATQLPATWVSPVAAQAGASDLKVTQTVQRYQWNGTTYVTTAVTKPASVLVRAKLEAAWTAADGQAKTLAITSDSSNMIYGSGRGYNNPALNSSALAKPIIRQGNPSNIPGVIPLVSGDQATAASNPQPILLGATGNSRVGTSFDVLNYIPEGQTAKIIKRFQNEVIKCRCQYGAGGGYSVAGAPQWPTIWDGDTYTTYKGNGSPAGVAANAGEDSAYSGSGKKNSARLQSPECTECCRDHHDSPTNTVAESKFDPEATATGKFNLVNGALTPVSSGAYVAACRVIKSDGIWKTAADTYVRHFGLLETASDPDRTPSNTPATSGLATDAAKTAYTGFVKDFLAQYTGSTATPGSFGTGAQAMFDQTSRGLNAPTEIHIQQPSTTDLRYLHGRGLFVDYLGTAALAAVDRARTKCGATATSAQLAECILPVLPFTTINMTEMASWTASSTTVLDVNQIKALQWLPAAPSGGRTRGIGAGNATNTGATRLSNSGLAVSDDIPGAVDTNGDSTISTDVQAFRVGGVGSSNTTGHKFEVAITGGGTNVGVKFVVGDTDKGNCTFSTNYSCPTNSTLPLPAVLTLSNYFKVKTPGSAQTWTFTANQCLLNGAATGFPAGTYTLPTGMPKTLLNQLVSAVSVNSTTLTGPWPASRNNALPTEETDISIGSIPAPVGATPALISITLVDDGTNEIKPTVKSCTASQANGKNKPIAIQTVVWNESWAN